MRWPLAAVAATISCPRRWPRAFESPGSTPRMPSTIVNQGTGKSSIEEVLLGTATVPTGAGRAPARVDPARSVGRFEENRPNRPWPPRRPSRSWRCRLRQGRRRNCRLLELAARTTCRRIARRRGPESGIWRKSCKIVHLDFMVGLERSGRTSPRASIRSRIAAASHH